MGIKLSYLNIIQRGINKIKSLYLGNRLLWQQELNENKWVFMPIVMQSTAYIRNSFNSELPDQVQIIITGNSSFILKSQNNIKLSDIEVIYPYESFNRGRPKCHFLKLDDYALYIHRFYGWNVWNGGTTTAIWDETSTLNYFGQEKSVKLYGYTDENNRSYINGLYVNKVIKSPACGSSGIVNIQFFPYTFDDELFAMNIVKLYLLDYTDTTLDGTTILRWDKKYLWDNEDKVFRHETNGTIINLDDTIFSSFNVTYEGITGKIEYAIKPNYTNEFKDIALCTNDAMVHFVQEPHNDHRIYIGEYSDHTYLTGTSQYIDSPSFPQEYLFHLCGSKIIDKTITFNIDYRKIVMYPTSIENDYDIIISGTCFEKGTYIWDNLEYKHYEFYKYAKITFKKK